MFRLCWLLVLFVFAALRSSSQDVDVLSYQFVIDLNDKNDTVAGLAVISFIKQTANPIVHFDLASVNRQGKGMKAYMVSLDESTPLPFTHASDRLSISLTKKKKGDTVSLYIAYKGIPSDGLIISKNKFGERTFFADNWPDRAHNWIPCNDRPNDKAMFEFRVTAPEHYTVISNGIKNGEKALGNGNKRTVWTETIPSATKVMVIGVARFAVKEFGSELAGVPVSAWVYPQDSVKGFYDYALAPEIVKFFSGYVASFPYKKLANVESKTIFGGMENASAIFYAESSVTGDRSSEDLLAHEIAHQWFGDMASEKSFAHLWLSEGFATYMTNIYLEQKYGQQKMEERMKEDSEKIIEFAKKANTPVVDTTKNLMSLLNANSYQKGSWVLHMLRNEVGDRNFQKIIQTYYQQYRGGNADSRDFEAIAEKVSGKELSWFFDQWLYRGGIPVLEMETSMGDKMFTLYVKQKEKVFRFNLEISVVEEDGEVTTKQFLVTEKESAFKIPVRSSAVQFSIDPNVKLLYELKD